MRHRNYRFEYTNRASRFASNVQSAIHKHSVVRCTVQVSHCEVTIVGNWDSLPAQLRKEIDNHATTLSGLPGFKVLIAL
jgi:hypothetical protein